LNTDFEMQLRVAMPQDIGQIAYMIYKWDNDLPERERQVGTSENAERAATLLVNRDNYITYVLEKGDELIGIYCILLTVSLWNPIPYGLLHLFVHKSYRGGKFLGLRLLKSAVDMAKTMDIKYLGILPRKDARGINSILKRLGFEYTNNGYVLPIGV